MSRLNLRNELINTLREEGETIIPFNAQKKDNLLPTIQKLKDLYRVVLQKRQDSEELISDKPMPMEYVFKNCRRYKHELQRYQWPENLHDNSKPLPVNNDALDCSRYIETCAPHYHTPGSRFIENRSAGAYRRVGRNN